MKHIFYSAVLGASLFGVVACSKAEPEQSAEKAPEPEVPMSADVAEPTGVMTAEPEQEPAQEPAPTAEPSATEPSEVPADEVVADATVPEADPAALEAEEPEIPEEALKGQAEPVDEPETASEQPAEQPTQ